MGARNPRRAPILGRMSLDGWGVPADAGHR